MFLDPVRNYTFNPGLYMSSLIILLFGGTWVEVEVINSREPAEANETCGGRREGDPGRNVFRVRSIVDIYKVFMVKKQYVKMSVISERKSHFSD